MRVRPSPIFLVLLCSTLGTAVHAQARNRNWHFGHGASLDMSTAPPTSLEGSAMSTDEGVASISDTTGQLLFYTNGETIWGRNHAPLPNGTGLAGHYSASQSALIVPMPGATDLYYVFTVPAQLMESAGLPPALRWSLVDMSLNGGLGEVTEKNIALSGPVAEKLTATRHANGQDIWVVVHEWDGSTYAAYRVSCTGIDGPVRSEVGRPMSSLLDDSHISALGYMQFSLQGDRLATAWTRLPTDLIYSAMLDVVRFDNATGIFSDAISDTQPGAVDNPLFGYGVAFAPNGRYLYTSEYGLAGGMSTSRIRQYDLEAPDPMNTEAIVGQSDIAYGALQRGSDGSIYTARLNGTLYLGRIDAPDLPGAACGMSDFAVELLSGVGTWGLPNDWDFSTEAPQLPEPIAWTDTTTCNGASVSVDATGEGAYATATFLWNTGSTSAVLAVAASGLYAVEVHLPCTTLFDTVHVLMRTNGLDLGADQALCEGDSVTLNVPPLGTVLWSDGGTDTSMTAQTEGDHWVVVTDSTGCIATDTVHVDLRDCRCPMFLPNAFTPDGDEVNDQWGPVYSCDLLAYDLSVYDRWGHAVHTTNDPAWTWTDERGDLPQGLFTWTLAYAWHDGTRVRERTERGHVSVVR